jgi:glucan biosynthesis protein C
MNYDSLVEYNAERYDYLDASRAFALLLGIFFHGVCFMVSYLGPGFWAVRNSQTNIFIDFFFFLAHTFRMQAFFLISGFFAHMIYHRKGTRGFFIQTALKDPIATKKISVLFNSIY